MTNCWRTTHTGTGASPETALRAEVFGPGALQTRLTDMLPFTLTGAQQQAVADIAADMSKPQRMLRLLQGDVGSGKTMVALIAMMQAVDNGAQAV